MWIGRNGGYLVRKGHRVIFIDNDLDCLKFIQDGNDLGIEKNFIRTMKLDLHNERLPFTDQSIVGVINIHCYDSFLITEIDRVLCPGGFICFESIDARGDNIKQLHIYNPILESLKSYKSLEYHQKHAGPKWMHRGTLKLFAIKQDH